MRYANGGVDSPPLSELLGSALFSFYGFIVRRKRDGESKHTSLSRTALDPDLASVGLDNSLCARQPQPASSGLACRGSVDLKKPLKDPVPVLERDALTLVGHAHANIVRFDLARDRNLPAAWRV